MIRFNKAGAGSLLSLTFATAIGCAWWMAAHRARPTMDFLEERAPSAAALLHPSVPLLPLPNGRFTALVGAREGSRDRRPMEVVVPQRATEALRVGSSPGDELVLVGAGGVPATLERGAAVYEEAYPGVNVVASVGENHLEIGYVLRAPSSARELVLHLNLRDDDSLRTEPGTGALLLAESKRDARLRIGAPMAIDAEGHTRKGAYVVAGGDLRIDVPLTGLSYPVVIDPSLAFPVWTILSDARGPGSELYDPDRLSMETHFVDDTNRGVVVAVRPTQSRQLTDATVLTGSPYGIYGTLRATPNTTPTPGPKEAAEWSRGYDFGGETWEWSGNSWQLQELATLPGLVDPSMTYDPVRSRVVLYGGAPPGLQCFLADPLQVPSCADVGYHLDVTYEYAGGAWVAREIPSAPPPRLRAAMAFDATTSRVILFGGRQLLSQYVSASFSAQLFPENLAGSLLADTWAYDGTIWARIPTQSQPPPLEGAQLVADPVRKVLVLIGGHSSSDLPGASDPLRVWEFDGVDWSERVSPGTPSLPVSLQTRRGVTAFWNPTLQRVVIEGGSTAEFDMCPLSTLQIEEQVAAIGGDPAAMSTFAQTGCLGGYGHDSWTWDGTRFTRIGDIAYGGSVGTQAVFRQVTGDPTWVAAGAGPSAAASTGPLSSGLLPWRYDPNPNHFPLRTTLERAYEKDGGLPAPPEEDAGSAEDAAPSSATPPTFASPLFATRAHGHVFFNTANAEAYLFFADVADIGNSLYQTLHFDGATWGGDTAALTPFANGTDEFFAAAWDTSLQRIILFDPRTGFTWTYTDSSGWASPSAVAPLPAWDVDPTIHVVEQAYAPTLAQIPQMTFDRVRNVALMTYEGSLFQFNQTGWSSIPLPASMTNCAAALQLEFDATHAQTVLVGCTVPAQTWTFDGANWTGPGPSPFLAQLNRGFYFPWKGTVQLAWAHPNSIFDSPSLGGVSLIDSDGTVTTWTGQAWTRGPTMAGGTSCFAQIPNPYELTYGTLSTLNPVVPAFSALIPSGVGPFAACLNPPAIEDSNYNRIVAFRGGPVGMERLGTTVPAAQRSWGPLEIGYDSVEQRPPGAEIAPDVQVNPYPFELLSAEVTLMQTQSDPATRSGSDVGDEPLVSTLFWPYRVLRDPATGTIRLLTHRGMVWQLTGEPTSAPGETCSTNTDCADGYCSAAEHVCCDTPFCGSPVFASGFGSYGCTTCRGATPGVCSAVPSGQPDPAGSCGSGPCAGVCSGTILDKPVRLPRDAVLRDGGDLCKRRPDHRWSMLVVGPGLRGQRVDRALRGRARMRERHILCDDLRLENELRFDLRSVQLGHELLAGRRGPSGGRHRGDTGVLDADTAPQAWSNHGDPPGRRAHDD